LLFEASFPLCEETTTTTSYQKEQRMKNKALSLNNAETDESPTVGEKITDAAGQVKQKVSDLGRTASDKIDEHRDATASGLEKASSALHEKAESLPGGDKVSGLAHATADKLGSTADYVREHDVNSMMADVEAFVKKNPGRALLGAAVVGFLVGRAFSSND
jgi:ElaB/YqjD/DUF883 family membrane-anchored ribosome-binding protein